MRNTTPSFLNFLKNIIFAYIANNMEFYYDPLLGLVYRTLEPIFIIDVAVLPHVDTAQLLRLMHSNGMVMCDSVGKKHVDSVYLGIKSNF